MCPYSVARERHEGMHQLQLHLQVEPYGHQQISLEDERRLKIHAKFTSTRVKVDPLRAERSRQKRERGEDVTNLSGKEKKLNAA